VHCKNTSYAAFFGAQSAQKARKYANDAANANALLSSQLQYIFAVSRIAHYMKAMMRDKIGSFAAASNVEDYLNRWLTQYVLLDDNASQEQKAQFPLREASVQVRRCRAAGRLPRGVLPASALPARRAVRFAPTGRGVAAIDQILIHSTIT
jgi:type VI secretion system ImpC/EvpB family protein